MLRTIARPLLAALFAEDGARMLLNTADYTDNAKAVAGTLRRTLPRNVSVYVPRNPETNVRIAATAKVVSALMLATGKAPRLAAGTLALTHIPAIATRRAFWNTKDEAKKKDQQRGMLTDLALLGGLAIATADTAGKPGVKWRVQKALPGKSQQEEMLANAQEHASDFLDRAKDAASQAQEAVRDYVDEHSDEWKETAEHLRAQAVGYAGAISEEAQKKLK